MKRKGTGTGKARALQPHVRCAVYTRKSTEEGLARLPVEVRSRRGN